jgi:D-alanyl-D-alanine carboxypeptidase
MLDEVVSDGVPGAILLVRDGDRTVRLTSGSARLAPRARMEPNYRFRVGSVTKSFVSAVVLELVGEGKLSLSDTVDRWLPRVVPNGDHITVRQLLNHTSGLYNYTDDPRLFQPFLAGDWDHVFKPLELVAIATSHRPLFEPGARWSYSSTNFILLGLIVEAATGRPLDQELRERIFRPLGLADTSLDSRAQMAGRYAHGYGSIRPDGGGPLRDLTNINPSVAWAAGGIVSTTKDLADFYRGLLRGKLVTRHLVWRMESTVKVDESAAYGLGLQQTRLPCSYVWGHTGDFPGFITVAASSGSGARQVVLSLNSDALRPGSEASIEGLLVTAYCGEVARG